MPYPSLEQYNQAFQAHSKLLTDVELRGGTLATTPWGLPQVISGGFALTYTIATSKGKFAVRCFHRESKELARRYSSISSKLAELGSPYFVQFVFQPSGIVVGGVGQPIVKMRWAEGSTLGEFMEANHSNGQALARLSASIMSLGAFLRASGVAHGDLQPGNLMVSRGGEAVQLIDYDGMYVDDIKGIGSSELGHPNFQHPDRQRLNPFDADLDRFSLLALALGVKALRADPTLWRKTSSEAEAIVFRSTDFKDPESSPTFALLAANPALAKDAEHFARVCKSDMAKTPTLDDFMAGRSIPFAAVDFSKTARRAPVASGYVGLHDVLAANDYDACLRRVSEVVEVVGRVVGVKRSPAKNKKQYLFVNFGPLQGRIFKIAIWSQGLAVIRNMPDASWVGKWVSVVGLMMPPYLNKRSNYTQVSINVSASYQLTILSEAEARRRLAAPPAKGPTGNQGVLINIGIASPAPPPRPGLVAPSPPARPVHAPAASPNAAALQAILSQGAAAPARPPPPPATPRPPPPQPAKTPDPFASPAPAPSRSEWGSAWWVVGLIAVFLIWFSNRSPSTSPTAPAAAPPPAAAPAAAPRPVSEIAPPLRHRGPFQPAEMRYCVATKARVGVWEEVARPGNASDARRLHQLGADFASRCSGYSKYREEAQQATADLAGGNDFEREARIFWFAGMPAETEAAASSPAGAPASAVVAPTSSAPLSSAEPAPQAPPGPTAPGPTFNEPKPPTAPTVSQSPPPPAALGGQPTASIPDNAQPNAGRGGWTCKRGFVEAGGACAAVAIPANAQLDYTGRAWTCQRGFQLSGSQCVEVQMPANAQIDYTGHAWACKRGSAQAGGECLAVQMPENAQIDYTGHAWTCARGFALAGASCVAVAMPQNAQLDYTGHAWTCKRGFAQVAQECREVQLPPNAKLDYTGHGWTCDRGYRLSERSCVSTP